MTSKLTLKFISISKSDNNTDYNKPSKDIQPLNSFRLYTAKLPNPKNNTSNSSSSSIKSSNMFLSTEKRKELRRSKSTNRNFKF